jgi:hypothetical protein
MNHDNRRDKAVLTTNWATPLDLNRDLALIRGALELRLFFIIIDHKF